MNRYPFDLIRPEVPGPLQDPTVLAQRPFTTVDRSFASEARLFIPGEELAVAINTALAVGEPLLITGEPGTGKTQAAYYAAFKLGLEPLIHFQVKSDSTAGELLYHFDSVRYFHDAHAGQLSLITPGGDPVAVKKKYVEKRALWLALERAQEKNLPAVLLIDEIDKAPRDFPNDLLLELDKMEFTVRETGELISAPRILRPILFITSNSERRLPEPFLRRCVYHHIVFDDQIVEKAVAGRRTEFTALSDEVVKLAMERFLALRDRTLRKRPATGEFLVWLRVLAAAVGTTPQRLEECLKREDLAILPYLGVLLKDRRDLEEVQASKT